jgi:hypothetical protein
MKRTKEHPAADPKSDTYQKSLREQRCEDSASRLLKDGRNDPPGPRGACAKKSRTQGSE